MSGEKKYLDARFDVTGWSEKEIAHLWGEVYAQGESSDADEFSPGHPDAEVEIELVVHEADEAS